MGWWPWSHCCSMASRWSSADWACMACSWCAADMGGGRPPGSSRGYGVPGTHTREGGGGGSAWAETNHGCDVDIRGGGGWAHRRPGGGASRVRAAAVPAGGWGWRRGGTGSGPGEVRLPGGLLPGDEPPNLEDTQDIHHHLLGVRVISSGHSFHSSSHESMQSYKTSDFSSSNTIKYLKNIKNNSSNNTILY